MPNTARELWLIRVLSTFPLLLQHMQASRSREPAANGARLSHAKLPHVSLLLGRDKGFLDLIINLTAGTNTPISANAPDCSQQIWPDRQTGVRLGILRSRAGSI